MEPRSLTTAVPSSTCSALGPTRGTEALSTEKTKQMWFKGFGLYTRCNPDLLDHVQVSVGQGGGLQFQIVELEQAYLGFQILEPGHRDLFIL